MLFICLTSANSPRVSTQPQQTTRWHIRIRMNIRHLCVVCPAVTYGPAITAAHEGFLRIGPVICVATMQPNPGCEFAVSPVRSIYSYIVSNTHYTHILHQRPFLLGAPTNGVLCKNPLPFMPNERIIHKDLCQSNASHIGYLIILFLQRCRIRKKDANCTCRVAGWKTIKPIQYVDQL